MATNLKTLKEALVVSCKAGLTPNLVGHRGMGKTQFVHQIGKELGMEVIPVHIGQMTDAGDLLGLGDFVTDAKGKKVATKFFKPNWWPRTDKPVILFLDEINRARPEIFNAVFELVGPGHSLHGENLPVGSFVVAACNPPTESYVVFDFADEAWHDRFVYFKFENTPEEWSQFMLEQGHDKLMVSFFKNNPDILMGVHKPFNIDGNSVSSCRTATNLINLIETQKPSDDALSEIAIGMLGTANGIRFVNEFKDQNLHIKGIDVLDNYETVKDKVEKYADHANPRKDVFNRTNDEILAEIEKSAGQESMPNQDKRVENLVEYLVTLPADMGTGFAIKLLTSGQYSESFLNQFANTDNKLVRKFEEYKKEGILGGLIEGAKAKNDGEDEKAEKE